MMRDVFGTGKIQYGKIENGRQFQIGMAVQARIKPPPAIGQVDDMFKPAACWIFMRIGRAVAHRASQAGTTFMSEYKGRTHDLYSAKSSIDEIISCPGKIKYSIRP